MLLLRKNIIAHWPAVTAGRGLLLYILALVMESTKSSLFGKSYSPPVIDPRLLSLESGLPQAEGPFAAALVAAGPVWKRGSKQSEFQKHLPDETDVASHISQHTNLDSLQTSVVINNVSTTSIDLFGPTIGYPSTANTDSLLHNDFDAAFLQLETGSDTEIADANAISYLSLWVAKNKSIRPPAKQLKALETLTEVPAARLLAWLTRHGRALLAEPKPTLNRAKVSFVPEELYFVRCLKSGFRYRPRKSDSDEPKVFECTNQCGQLFYRKGDWGRHERLNFEEWPCPHCGKVLSRCEHLRAHFKDAHPIEKDISKYQKREFLTARQRPCGFCGNTLTDWSAWLAHVASHFEESREGRGRTMSYWTEYRFFDEDEVEVGTAVTAPEEAVPATMTALEAQSDHITSSALWRAGVTDSNAPLPLIPPPPPSLKLAPSRARRRLAKRLAMHKQQAEAKTLDEQNEKAEKSARQDKDDGSDTSDTSDGGGGNFHGQIGNLYNDSKLTTGPESSTKVQTGNRNGGAPSFKDDISHNPTYGNAGRHMPERQASGEPASSSYSGSRHSVAGGRHPNTDRHKAKFPARDSFGHRNSSDEDCDHLIGHSTRPAALARHQPTAYVSPRHSSSRHARHEDHDYTISQSTRSSALSKRLPTAHESTRLSSTRRVRQSTPPILGHHDTSDEDRDYTISQSTRLAALSRHQRHESTRLGSARHTGQPIPPMPASQARRGVESGDSYDALESMYGAMRIRDSEPESANLDRHHDQGKLSRYKAKERRRY
jgi:hypothetical protein